jgi:hypothetical protein
MAVRIAECVKTKSVEEYNRVFTVPVEYLYNLYPDMIVGDDSELEYIEDDMLYKSTTYSNNEFNSFQNSLLDNMVMGDYFDEDECGYYIEYDMFEKYWFYNVKDKQ